LYYLVLGVVDAQVLLMHNSMKGVSPMVYRFAVASACLWAFCAPALSLEPPVVWREPETGCAYLLTPQGGVSPRLRRDGLPDCPDASASSRLVDDAARGISRGLDTLQREVERLRERFRDQPPSSERMGDRT
jgi:hypothetical protein